VRERTTQIPAALPLLLLLSNPAPARAELRVQGTLVELPRTEPCLDHQRTAVTTLYRVQRVLEGHWRDPTILVVHRCPEIPRGPSRYGRGDARAMKPGRVHRLTLRPMATTEGVQDRFQDDLRTRYRAIRTDRGPAPPRMVVVVNGGAGASIKLTFDATRVTVGRSLDADVMLSSPTVARRHLRLEVTGQQVTVRPLARASLNGKPLKTAARITFKDRIQLDGYTLRVALFLGGED
jgi:hypothetical protein